jgi:tetratricopeptide (TPR) repeat protein
MKPANFLLKIYILTLLNIFVINIFGQNSNDSIIYWDKDIRLTWNDFQCRMLEKSSDEEKAKIAAGTRYIFYVENEIPNFWVFTFSNKVKSCVSDSLFTSKSGFRNLLEHEQLHFDIHELYTRKIREQFGILKEKRISIDGDYEDVYLRLFDQCKQMNELYEKETQHGLNLEKQREWCNRIDKELESLEIYYIRYSGQIEDRHNEITYYNRGIEKFNFKDYPEAILEFSNVIKLDSSNANAFFYRGWSRIESGDIIGGCDDFNSALQLGHLEAPVAIRAFCE